MINFDFDKLALESLDRVTLFEKNDDSIVFILDQLKDGNLENGSNTIYSTGKQGMKLSGYDREKSAKFTCNNGYVVASAISAQTGGNIENASTTNKLAVPHLQYIKVTDTTKVVLEYTPIGVTGKEISYIYKANADNTQGEKFPIAATASAVEFSLDPATKTITLPTDIFEIGDIVIVAYRREASIGKKIINSGDKFAKSGRVVIDCTAHDVCDNNLKYHAIFEMGNAKVDGNFSFSFGNEPVAHAVSIEALLDVCSVDRSLWTMYIT